MAANVRSLLRELRQLQAERDSLRGELEKARHASRTRDGYNLRCHDCGAPHWLDTSLPSEIWNQIADPAEILCLLCIDTRLEKAGLTCDQAEFYFVGKALKSRLYAESHGEVAALKAELAKLREEKEDLNRTVEAIKHNCEAAQDELEKAAGEIDQLRSREKGLKEALTSALHSIGGWHKVSIGSIDSHFSGHFEVERWTKLMEALEATPKQEESEPRCFKCEEGFPEGLLAAQREVSRLTEELRNAQDAASAEASERRRAHQQLSLAKGLAEKVAACMGKGHCSWCGQDLAHPHTLCHTVPARQALTAFLEVIKAEQPQAARPFNDDNGKEVAE